MNIITIQTHKCIYSWVFSRQHMACQTNIQKKEIYILLNSQGSDGPAISSSLDSYSPSLSSASLLSSGLLPLSSAFAYFSQCSEQQQQLSVLECNHNSKPCKFLWIKCMYIQQNVLTTVTVLQKRISFPFLFPNIFTFPFLRA